MVQGEVHAKFGPDPSSSLGEEWRQTKRQTDRHTFPFYMCLDFFTRKSSNLCCKGSCQFTHIDTRRRRRFCILNRTRTSTIKMQKAKTNHDGFFTVSGLYSHLHFRTLNLQFSIRTTSWSRLPTTYRSSSTTWNQVDYIWTGRWMNRVFTKGSCRRERG